MYCNVSALVVDVYDVMRAVVLSCWNVLRYFVLRCFALRCTEVCCISCCIASCCFVFYAMSCCVASLRVVLFLSCRIALRCIALCCVVILVTYYDTILFNNIMCDVTMNTQLVFLFIHVTAVQQKVLLILIKKKHSVSPPHTFPNDTTCRKQPLDGGVVLNINSIPGRFVPCCLSRATRATVIVRAARGKASFCCDNHVT